MEILVLENSTQTVIFHPRLYVRSHIKPKRYDFFVLQYNTNAYSHRFATSMPFSYELLHVTMQCFPHVHQLWLLWSFFPWHGSTRNFIPFGENRPQIHEDFFACFFEVLANTKVLNPLVDLLGFEPRTVRL